MIGFESDYMEGCHVNILKLLEKTNFEQTLGYGEDHYCEKARNLILSACGFDKKVGANRPDIHFLVGGTQTNMVVISSVLRPHQGVVSACSGHINVHEAGAIEATGHKVLSIESNDGKIDAKQVEECYLAHINDVNHEHMVQPGMVYISFPTENGTIYTKNELKELYLVCKKYSLPLFIDGARLGYGLTATSNDLTLEDIASLCDVFYIGATKIGALFGEAVVIVNQALKKDFRYLMKQRGGMLAKGRILGLQFLALFQDNLYFKIAAHANLMAQKIKQAFADRGFSFLYDSFTNQQFPILSNSACQQLKKKYLFSFWQKVDSDHLAVRFCTSWATQEKDVEQLVSDIAGLKI